MTLGDARQGRHTVTGGARRIPAIPRCGVEHRLATLEAIEVAFANDAAAEIAHMVEIGFPLDAAVDAVRNCYQQWVLARVANAIQMGAGWGELSQRAAA